MTKNLVNQRETGEYNKFYVDRVDERDAPGGDRHGADYLVLDLTFDKHAMAGLKAYADAVEADYPQFAADLRARIPQSTAPIVADPIKIVQETNVHQEAQEYEFRGDFDYTPNEVERTLLEDFGNGLVSTIVDRIKSPSV